MRDPDAFLVERVDQVQQLFQRIEIGTDVGQLRADMAIDADDIQARERLRGAVGVQRGIDGDAELVFFQAGGDIGVAGAVRPRIRR
ncbi:hypothetical protein G6F31_019233 [Rhizopus arrhizus]|nr:hypothetical protein G6F31_019233 [Rhizopus arrhizus]